MTFFKNLLYLATLSIFATSCKNVEQEKNSANQISTEESKEVETKERPKETIRLNLKEESSYAYIRRLFKREGKNYIEVDFIRFFDGDRAIEEAQKRGDADYHVDEDGDTSYYVLND
jgi:hypothetical protein